MKKYLPPLPITQFLNQVFPFFSTGAFYLNITCALAQLPRFFVAGFTLPVANNYLFCAGGHTGKCGWRLAPIAALKYSAIRNCLPVSGKSVKGSMLQIACYQQCIRLAL